MKSALPYFLLLLSGACASVNTSSSADSESYKEDLSMHRTKYTTAPDTTSANKADLTRDYSEITPENDVTRELNTILDGTDELRKDINTVDGFTIQVYAGNDTDEARKAKGMALAILPDEYVNLFYDEPSFKVKVGQYFTRSEARENYPKLKQKFPTALIIPDKIPIP